MSDYYATALEEIKKHLNTFYNRYATDEGVSLSEAKQRVSVMDLTDFKNMIDKINNQTDDDNREYVEMRTQYYQATAQINRGYMLDALIGLTIVGLAIKQQKTIKGRLTKDVVSEDNYTEKVLKPVRTSKYALLHDHRTNQKLLDSVINNNVSGSNWSDMLWNNSDIFTSQVQGIIKQNLNKGITNKDIENMFKHVSPNVLDGRTVTGRFNVAQNNVMRLLRSESARVTSEYDRQTYQRAGIKKVRFVDEPGACKICAELVGVYPINKAPQIIGDTHPNCRCHLEPVIETE